MEKFHFQLNFVRSNQPKCKLLVYSVIKENEESKGDQGNFGYFIISSFQPHLKRIAQS